MFYWLADWARRTSGVALNGKLQPHWKLGCKLSMPRQVLSQFLIVWVFALYPSAKDKADLPLHSEWVEDVSRLGQWMLKNPSEKGARKRKRTPLTVPRKHSLRREGVKTTPPA